MKNESNRSPDALSKAAELGATAPARPPSGAAKAPPKRGDWVARTVHEAGQGWITAHFVPVSFVAKDWNVTSRRIRSLLAAERLQGRRGDNGYW